jgi:NitT/TauT family transport system ATP-binding protein|tara:strand:- start:573 stop:1403 length:831 start_codon:yes stop_codon:yes gene_type:complete
VTDIALSAAPAASPQTARRLVVAMHDVSKVFSNGTLALKGMSLDVKAGEFISLLGPSGCGKSTALRIIAGLGAPSSGSIDWPSSRINSKGLPEGDVGFVFQDPTLMPWATVFDNVFLPLKLRGISKASATETIMENLASVGLADFAASYPRELSGGMRMRVSIARAMVTKPKLLLMDEPFAALDEITRQKLNDDVLRLWKQHGVTVIFVTHSVYESAYLSSRIVVMRARPGQVYTDMAVTQPAERDQAYRVSEGYRQTCQDVSDALQGAIGAAEVH